MRHLGGAVQLQHVARGVVARDRAARLQRHAGMAADRKIERDDRVRGAKRAVEVAIGLLDDHRLGGEPGSNSPGSSSADITGGNSSISSIDRVGGVLGPIGIVREHHRDRLADIAHAAARQHRLAIGHELLDAVVAEIDRRQIGEVVAGPDRHHARAASAPPRRRSRRSAHARAASAPRACEAGAETKRRPRTGRGRRTSGPSSRRGSEAPMIFAAGRRSCAAFRHCELVVARTCVGSVRARVDTPMGASDAVCARAYSAATCACVCTFMLTSCERRLGLVQHAPALHPVVGALQLVGRDRRRIDHDDAALRGGPPA